MSTSTEIHTTDLASAGTRVTGADAPPSGPARPSPMAVVRAMAPTLLVDVALPYLVYLLLSRAGMSDVAALAWSALPAVLSVVVTAVRARRLNGVGMVVLGSIAVGIGTSLLSGDPRFAVARDALPGAVFALVLAGSLLVGGRPLLFHLIRATGETYRPGLRALMDHQWSVNPAYRTALRRATAVGAAVMAIEVGVRLLAAATLPVAVAMPLLQVQSFVVWAGLILLLRRTMIRAARSGAPDAERHVSA
ncbi:hypothetical protein EV383_5855 [Pseudonocardia sediminis]|uniref:Intracellular septation protein A n=1 Tax=Pseudonocardia sediminis TaxID=1397368 RepID=A0A4Q7V5P4_PSEST|nr:VC0807 family protein [Pseudonocardia sediminis]RZT88901.1 hypothetical protein EV383_5855 [Pseudonocardia sediminis]